MKRKENEYNRPTLTEYGTVESITEQEFNKDGLSTDNYTEDTDGEIVGSLQPV